MSKEKKLIPELRFPEFVKDGEWVEKPLNEVATFLKGKGISKSDVIENGGLPCIRYGELYTHYNETISAINSYTNLRPDDLVLSEANDVIIPASGETQEDIATASCVLKSGIALGGDLNIIRTKINGVFLSYFLNNVKKKEIAQLAQGISVVHLYPNQLKTLNVNIPDPKEQQKIVACISSLEALIKAQAEKIEQLKWHKKGLMQNLFPQKGKKVPKFRLPEFGKDGEWTEKTLGQLLEFKNGINAEKEQYGTGIKFINVLDILRNDFITYDKIIGSVDVDDETIGKFAVNYGDILFQRSSETQEEAGTANVYLDRKQTATFGGFVIRGRKVGEYEPIFLNKLLKSKSIRNSISSKSGGSTRFNIGQEILSSIKVLLPSLQEQQKIAACLVSLDEVITAQAEKIEQLKLHKKGLMQRMFPKTIE